MHSTDLEKNAVSKWYARPVFSVNEKCNVITQVWQNLALFDRFRLASPRPLRGKPGESQSDEKSVL